VFSALLLFFDTLFKFIFFNSARLAAKSTLSPSLKSQRAVLTSLSQSWFQLELLAMTLSAKS
jgi:hypothetical protein